MFFFSFQKISNNEDFNHSSYLLTESKLLNLSLCIFTLCRNTWFAGSLARYLAESHLLHFLWISVNIISNQSMGVTYSDNILLKTSWSVLTIYSPPALIVSSVMLLKPVDFQVFRHLLVFETSSLLLLGLI